MEFFQEWLGEIGIEAEVSVMESNQLTDVILEGNFDAFHWGWYVEPDPDAHPLGLPLRRARRLVRLVVLQRGVRRALRGPERRGRRREADRDDQADAGDHLPGLALPRHGVHQVRSGAPHRPVRVLPAAAGSRRGPAGAVRRLQLHASSARPTRPATATASRPRSGHRSPRVVATTTVAASRCGSLGGAVLRAGGRRRWWSRCVDGPRRTLGSEPSDHARGASGTEAVTEPTGRRRSYGRYVLGKVLGRAGEPVLRAGRQLLPVPGAAR